MYNFSTCHIMADEESGDEVGGHPHRPSWDVKMKEEMKARLEKRKRRHSCGEVVAGGGDAPARVLAGEVPSPSLLGVVGPELEKRRRHHSAGRVVAELRGGGDATDAGLRQPPLRLDVEPPQPIKIKIPGDKEIDKIARRVGYSLV